MTISYNILNMHQVWNDFTLLLKLSDNVGKDWEITPYARMCCQRPIWQHTIILTRNCEQQTWRLNTLSQQAPWKKDEIPFRGRTCPFAASYNAWLGSLLRCSVYLTSKRRLQGSGATYQACVWDTHILQQQVESAMAMVHRRLMRLKHLCPCTSTTTKHYIIPVALWRKEMMP